MPTATNYILIDFENVQPGNFELLKQHPFKVFVFVGENQTKVPIALAVAMQALGENGQYIQIAGNGPNALDFHIAFYIGQLASQDENGNYHIISKDHGFDPLIRHLLSQKIKVQRARDLAEISLLRACNAASKDEKIEIIINNIRQRGQSKPRKEKTLANTINSLFTKSLGDDEAMGLVRELEKRNFIAINAGKIAYMLPDFQQH